MYILNIITSIATIICAIPPLKDIFQFLKNKHLKKQTDFQTPNNTISNSKIYGDISQQTTIYNIGYEEYNLKDSRELSEDEIDNYNYSKEKINRYVRIIFSIIFIYYFYKNWNLIQPSFNNLFANLFSPDSNFHKTTIQLTVILIKTLHNTFNNFLFAQIVFSILVIIKMIINPQVYYRVKNILVYSISIGSVLFLFHVFNQINDDTISHFLMSQIIINSSTTAEPLKNFLLTISKFGLFLLIIVQTIYIIEVIISCLKILFIGEFKYKRDRIQKNINHNKILLIIFPILISYLWTLILNHLL